MKDSLSISSRLLVSWQLPTASYSTAFWEQAIFDFETSIQEALGCLVKHPQRRRQWLWGQVFKENLFIDHSALISASYCVSQERSSCRNQGPFSCVNSNIHTHFHWLFSILIYCDVCVTALVDWGETERAVRMVGDGEACALLTAHTVL